MIEAMKILSWYSSFNGLKICNMISRINTHTEATTNKGCALWFAIPENVFFFAFFLSVSISIGS
jgi:hypothetical protein